MKKGISILSFDDITSDGRLWAVRYEGDEDNILDSLFSQWDDVEWLRTFFKKNMADLQSYFRISDVEIAIDITAEDSDVLQRKILDLSPNANLDELFRPLNNYISSEFTLNREKANPKTLTHRKSWLRIYALKLEDGCYIITGGAIKLTKTMQEREHTLEELLRQEKVRNFLLTNQIIDTESFIEYLAETNNNGRLWEQQLINLDDLNQIILQDGERMLLIDLLIKKNEGKQGSLLCKFLTH